MIGLVRDRLRLGPRQYPGPGDMFLAAVVVVLSAAHLVAAFGVGPTLAQEPSGAYLQVGAAAFPGVGIQVGAVSAQGLFTREVNAILDLRSLSHEPVGQVVTTLGGAIRVLGIGRTIGGVRYRGFDIDVGFRGGPAFSFRVREDRAFRNRRFNLFLEPFVRWTGATKRRLFFVELGVHTPILRAGIWLPLGHRRVNP